MSVVTLNILHGIKPQMGFFSFILTLDKAQNESFTGCESDIKVKKTDFLVKLILNASILTTSL